MAIIILPFRPSDARPIVEMLSIAFATDALHQAGLPEAMTPEQEEEFKTWRTTLILDRSRRPNRHYFQAVDTQTGRIVGFSGWHGPLPKGDGVRKEPGERYPGAPGWLDKKHYDELGEMFGRARGEVMGDGEDFWYLQSMGVHPDYQGRGIGSLLMSDALTKLIDPDGADCYIESSPAARRLYEKHGFGTKLELPRSGGKYILSAMVRPAAERNTG